MGSCAHCRQNDRKGEPIELKPVIVPTISRDERTRKLWRELHTRALTVTDLSGEKKWLENWAGKVPCGECREHWHELAAELPPDLSSPDAYWRWTVEAHNRVNQRIGRPTLTVAQARELYSLN